MCNPRAQRAARSRKHIPLMRAKPACAGPSECRILQCSRAFKAAPANGQWQLARLLCIGATGIQASERALRKKIRGRKHA